MALRFMLELWGLFALGQFALHRWDGVWSYAGALGLPLLFAVIWGTFAVPGDPSRSGKAPIPIPGPLRLLLELSLFGLSACTLLYSGQPFAAATFALMLTFHYLATYQRQIWIWKQRLGSTN